MNSTDLYSYELIHDFFGNLDDSQYSKLLEKLEIPPFSLDEKTLNEIHSKYVTSELTDQFSFNVYAMSLELGDFSENTLAKLKSDELRKRGDKYFGDNKLLFKLIELTVTEHMVSVRKKLLMLIREKKFFKLYDDLSIKKDSKLDIVEE
jgi:hypothetical protein